MYSYLCHGLRARARERERDRSSYNNTYGGKEEAFGVTRIRFIFDR